MVPPTPASQGWLRSLVVWGGDDWSFDLSSQFQSNVTKYGVIVPNDFDNATLCAVPYQGMINAELATLSSPHPPPHPPHLHTRWSSTPSILSQVKCGKGKQV